MKYLILFLLLASCSSQKTIIVCNEMVNVQHCTEAILNKPVIIINIDSLGDNVYDVTYEEK